LYFAPRRIFWAYGSTDATNPATRGPVTWPRRGR